MSTVIGPQFFTDANLAQCAVVGSTDSTVDADALRSQLAEVEWEAQAASAVMDILLRAESQDRLVRSCAVIVNDFQRLLECEQVALGVCGKTPETFRIVSISGNASVDRRSDLVRLVEATLAEAVLRDELTVWPPSNGTSSRAVLAHQRLAERLGVASIVSAPLRSTDDAVVAVWAFLGSKKFAENEKAIRLIRASEPRAAACIDLLRKAESNRLRRWLHELTERKQFLTFRVLPAIAGAIFLALWIPTSYKIDCKCKVQPIVRRFVAAPFEGVLEKSLIEPGDVVDRDQTIAMMDGRDVRLAISETSADIKRADVKRNVQMAKQDQGAAKMAAYEKERLELKLKLLESQNEKLEIKSPIRGVVLRGDQKRAEGMPVSLGQNLFEIAPLDKMVVEVAIPERDCAETRVGQKVTVRVDAYPGDALEGTITRIQPRSEEWEDDYVFVAEMQIDNPREEFRPGMNGKAVIYGDRHFLFWNLFHKYWENVFAFLGW